MLIMTGDDDDDYLFPLSINLTQTKTINRIGRVTTFLLAGRWMLANTPE